MRTMKLIMMMLLFACISVTLAHAGSSVQKGQSTTINATVKNTTRSSALVAVKITGYDDSGSVIGHLCQNTYIKAGRTANVSFPWQAPNYGTGVYWASKVEAGVSCPSSVDEHDDDDDDHHHR